MYPPIDYSCQELTLHDDYQSILLRIRKKRLDIFFVFRIKLINILKESKNKLKYRTEIQINNLISKILKENRDD